MNSKVILTCAVTGNAPFNPKYPAMPATAARIAASCVKPPRPAQASFTFMFLIPPPARAAAIRSCSKKSSIRVRSSGVDIVLNLTCGLGAFLFPDPDDESRALVESEVLPVAERVRHLEDCLPEIACPDQSLCLSRSLERQPNKVIRSRRRTSRSPSKARLIRARVATYTCV